MVNLACGRACLTSIARSSSALRHVARLYAWWSQVNTKSHSNGGDAIQEQIERNVDIAAFQKSVQPVYDKYLKQIPNGESLVKQIREMK